MIKKTSKGFSLISAIFLLVVIAALGTFAVTLSTTQHQSEAMDVMGKRAYQAARAGIEWGAFQIIQSQAAPAFASNCQAATVNLPVSQAISAPAPSLSVFRVNVACYTGAASYVDGDDGRAVWVYAVSASAATGGAPGDANYIERQMSVTIAQ